MSRRFRRSDDVVERKVRDSLILVPLGTEAARIDSLYTLNEMGGLIWSEAAKGAAEDEIVVAIAGEYEADAETIRRDCRRLLDELVGVGALLVVEGDA